MFALAAMLAAIFDIAHLVGIAAAKHLVHETVIVAGIVTRMDVFEPVPVIDKDLFEDVPALSRFDNHQVAPSEGGWDMLRVQPVYHVSPAPSNPLIGLHPGMLTHIPSPGITGTSGQPKNENSYTMNISSHPRVRWRSLTNTQGLPCHRLPIMPSQNVSMHVPAPHSHTPGDDA